MSSAATITVQYANPPKEGKKQGSIKTTDGVVYGVFPDKLGLLRPQQTYAIEFDEREFNGRTYKTIRKVRPAAREPQNDNGRSPSHSLDAEFEFVTRCLPAMISAYMAGSKQETIAAAARMLRRAYRDAFTQGEHE